MFYTGPSGANGICPFGLFCFIMCILNTLVSTWTFRKNLRTLLHSWGFTYSIFFVRNFSVGGSKSGQITSSHWKFTHELLIFPPAWYYWRSPLLLPVFLYPPACLEAFTLGPSSRVFLDLSGGSPKFLEGLLCSCDWCPGKYDTCILFP